MSIVAHHIDARLTEDKVLVLQNLPFRAGDNVEVIVLEKQSVAKSDSEDVHFAEWKTASNRALQKVRDNDEDAAYDDL